MISDYFHFYDYYHLNDLNIYNYVDDYVIGQIVIVLVVFFAVVVVVVILIPVVYLKLIIFLILDWHLESIILRKKIPTKKKYRKKYKF